jgi:hypothetical protein
MAIAVISGIGISVLLRVVVPHIKSPAARRSEAKAH